jgi:hypothetical protein
MWTILPVEGAVWLQKYADAAVFGPFWTGCLCGTFFTFFNRELFFIIKSTTMYIGIGTLVLVVILFLIFRRRA